MADTKPHGADWKSKFFLQDAKILLNFILWDFFLLYVFYCVNILVMRICVSAFVVPLFMCPLYAQVLNNPNMGDDFLIYENAIVQPETRIDSGLLVVQNNNVLLENYGYINTDVILNSADLFIKNTGDFKGNFYLYNNSAVFQVIDDTTVFNPIGFNTDYGLVVEDMQDELKIADVFDFVRGAKSVSVKNSTIDLSGSDLHNLKNLNLIVDGVVVLKLDSLSGLSQDGVLFSNVDGQAQIYLNVDNADVLFSDFAYLDGGKIIVQKKRETDYSKVLNGNVGDFLDGLQQSGKNNALMNQLDNAENFDSFAAVMNNSVVFNTGKLFYPIKVLNARNKNDFVLNKIGADAFVLLNDEFNFYGVDLNVAMGNDKNYLYVGGQYSVLKYSSDVDKFDAKNYLLDVGGRVSLLPGVFINTELGFGIADYDVGEVVINNEVYNNPKLMSGYFVLDAGCSFNVTDLIRFIPFVGTEYNLYYTDEITEKELLIRGGAEMLYTHEMLGIRYNYGARLVASSYDGFYLSVLGGFWSQMDLVGGNIELSAIRIDDRFSYKVSLGANIKF